MKNLQEPAQPDLTDSLPLSVRASKIIIHTRQVSKTVTAYYFTKSKNRCLRIEYNKQWDFGKSPSGARLTDIEIHYQNHYITDELKEIELSDVASVIIDVLSYLL